MSSLASEIESSSLLSSSSSSTHLCWTLSFAILPNNEAKKIVGCRCSGLKRIEKNKLTKMITDNFMEKGQLCLEGKDK